MPSAKRKNAKPEKLVEEACVLWFQSKGWKMAIIDSKATFNPKAKRYLKSKAAPVGHSDSCGCTDTGLAVFVEFKAKGMVNDLSPEQETFLTERRACGAFTAVVDSVDLLEKLWADFNRPF